MNKLNKVPKYSERRFYYCSKCHNAGTKKTFKEKISMAGNTRTLCSKCSNENVVQEISRKEMVPLPGKEAIELMELLSQIKFGISKENSKYSTLTRACKEKLKFLNELIKKEK